MNTETDAKTTDTNTAESKEGKQNWIPIFMFLIVLVPMVAGYFIAFTGVGLPGGTKNNGELIQAGISVPQEIIDLQDGRWGLVVVSETCDMKCQEKVYRMQQLHKSMDKKHERIQAIWISSSKQDIDSGINVDQVKQLHSKAAVDWFKSQDLPWKDQSILVVDPQGFMVLRFSEELSAGQMMTDLKWLLKASRVG